MATNFVLSTGSDDGSSGIATSSGTLTFGGNPAAAGPTTSSTQGARSSILSSSPGGSAAQGLAAISDGGDGGDLGGIRGAGAPGQGTGCSRALQWQDLSAQPPGPSGPSQVRVTSHSPLTQGALTDFSDAYAQAAMAPALPALQDAAMVAVRSAPGSRGDADVLRSNVPVEKDSPDQKRPRTPRGSPSRSAGHAAPADGAPPASVLGLDPNHGAGTTPRRT